MGNSNFEENISASRSNNSQYRVSRASLKRCSFLPQNMPGFALLEPLPHLRQWMFPNATIVAQREFRG